MHPKSYPEKGQINPGSCLAFGISLDSRHSKAWELAEMLLFTDELAKAGLQQYVKSVFYDSNADLCQFEFTDEVEEFSPIEDEIKEAALKTISQFEWHGSVDHGDTMRNRNFPDF